MNRTVNIFIIAFLLAAKGLAQNWAPVPCYNGKGGVASMFVDSLHNELILNHVGDYSICNVFFKGPLAYNGYTFHDLDYGIDAYDTLNKKTGGTRFFSSITYQNKTLFGGLFSSVGSNTLHAQSLALWNGAVWDTFPKHGFNYDPYFASSVASLVYGFIKYKGKLWIYGQFYNLGGVSGKNLYTFDGNNFTNVLLPVNNYYNIRKLVIYHNELYAFGQFVDIPTNKYDRIAKFDGNNWLSVGDGLKGSNYINDMLVYNDTLYISGGFKKADGNAGNCVMKLSGNQWLDVNFPSTNIYSSIGPLLVFKNRLYAFGFCYINGNNLCHAALYYQNGTWVIEPEINNKGITQAVIYKNDIYVAAGFVALSGDSSIKYLAKLRCPDFDFTCPLGIEEQEKQNAGFRIMPNPANHALKLLSNTTEQGELSITNAMGQRILYFKNYLLSNELDISGLASGLYFIRLRFEDKVAVRKMVKE